MVPKFKCDKRQCHNQDLVLEALDKRQIGEDFIISSMDNVYKLDPLVPLVDQHLQDYERNSTKKFVYKVDELRAVFGHMLGATRVQVPEDDLDHLKLVRGEDGAVETLDP
ncbi:hypothetical protein Tco_0180828 [Tanacetum coccineum]